MVIVVLFLSKTCRVNYDKKSDTYYTLGWSVKKNIPRILTTFGGVVGSLSQTTQKKFQLPRWRARRAEGSQRARSFEKKNVFFFFFFSASQNGLRFMKQH